ncbi:MAG: divalent-cation tolerance protein CutA [Thermoanaerobaculia bacterium]
MTAPGESPLLALSTVGGMDDAERIARTLVGERLAACVNLVRGLRSIYRWQGAVSDEPEVLLLMKTTRVNVEALRERLLQIHPYEVPEFVAIELADVAEAYGKWLVESVTPSG